MTIPRKHFYMTRHGQTVANVEKYVAGSMDTPLTEQGKDEARSMQPILSTLSPQPTHIIHSNLTRAYDTANLMNGTLNLPMSENQSIAERDLGEWKGLPLEQWHERRIAGLTPPGGEAHNVFRERVSTGIYNILNASDGPILLVTHAGVFREFMAHHKVDIGTVKNCTLYEFTPNEEGSSFPWTLWQHVRANGGEASREAVELNSAN